MRLPSGSSAWRVDVSEKWQSRELQGEPRLVVQTQQVGRGMSLLSILPHGGTAHGVDIRVVGLMMRTNVDVGGCEDDAMVKMRNTKLAEIGVRHCEYAMIRTPVINLYCVRAGPCEWLTSADRGPGISGGRWREAIPNSRPAVVPTLTHGPSRSFLSWDPGILVIRHEKKRTLTNPRLVADSIAMLNAHRIRREGFANSGTTARDSAKCSKRTRVGVVMRDAIP